MKARMLAVGIVIGLVLALTLGFAYRGTASVLETLGVDPGFRSAMEAMHDSPMMRATHDQMSDRLQQQCDTLHGRMVRSGTGMMGSGWMMGSGGMMGLRHGMTGG